MTQFNYRDDAMHVENVPLERLADEYGTPLYVYSSDAILERYSEFARAFGEASGASDGASGHGERADPHGREGRGEPSGSTVSAETSNAGDRAPLIAYSVKANGNLSILRLLNEAGAGADIVSGGELYRALEAGVPPERIVFSGVGKTRAELAAGLDAGIYAFNVESEGELRALAEVAAEMDVCAPVALRVNPDIEAPTPHAYTRTGHRASKFGIPGEDAVRLYRLAAAELSLDVRGIDVHIGSQIQDVEPYREALDYVLDIVEALRGDGITLEYLDLGGGFGIAYQGDGADGPSAADFAEAIVPAVADAGLRLVLEPGRYIMGEAGVLLTRATYVKRGGGRTFVVTDAGMNDMLRPSHYAGYHAIQPVRRDPGRDREQADVVGPICETGDFLALDRELPEPRPGDLLAVRTAGAYGFAMASTYNARPRPAEVLVDGERARLIRRRETYEDLVRGEEVAAE